MVDSDFPDRGKVLTVIEVLRKNRFKAEFFQTSQDVLSHLLEVVPIDVTVGVAGSWTLTQLGALKSLKDRGNTTYCHFIPGLSPEEVMDMRRKQLTCDVFLCGANAITEDGQLVNTDATGNRVAAMIFGPKKTIIITGFNKIVKDLAAAQERIRTIAAPQNNKRLKRPNPCVETGYCVDCQGPSRLCNVQTILQKCPQASNIHVWVVGEELGQ